jgi:hypothetical protein
MDKALDFLSAQFDSFNILPVERLPDTLDQFFINCAVDVISASMVYLAALLRYHSRSRLSGIMRSPWTARSYVLRDSALNLKTNVERFNRSVDSMNLKSTVKTYEVLEGMSSSFPLV